MNGGTDPHFLFLTKAQVLEYHRQQIGLFGGAHGMIDEGMLDSALAQPQTTWCYDSSADLFDLAAAYAFHLAKGHAFRDGNKRVALHAALAFLKVNHASIECGQNEMFEAMSQLVTSVIDKRQFAAFLRQHAA
jgi:death-on-curing protein